jgi:hypothetical protein
MKKLKYNERKGYRRIGIQMDKKKLAMVAAVVIVGVAKGPYLRDRVLNWYSQKSGSLVEGAAKVGFGKWEEIEGWGPVEGFNPPKVVPVKY